MSETDAKKTNKNTGGFTVTEEIEHYSPFNLNAFKEWLSILLLAFCIVYLVNTYVIVNANVPTGSMIPTINPEEKIIASRFAYHTTSPERGDVVIFRYPDNEEILYVKRVIGLPGDEVLIKDGNVYINGVKLEEPYVKKETKGNFGPYEVPEGCYFMLGDNRNNSEDSRFWHNKFVSEEKILGKVVIKYNIIPPYVQKIK